MLFSHILIFSQTFFLDVKHFLFLASISFFFSSVTIQSSGHPGLGLRPLNSPSSVSGTGSYDQLLQQYQLHHNPSHSFLQQMSPVGQSYRDQGNKSIQASQAAYDPFSLLGLLKVIRMSDPDLTALSLGMDLTTLGLNLNSAENLHKTFCSPWSDEPSKGDPQFTVSQCYYATTTSKCEVFVYPDLDI